MTNGGTALRGVTKKFAMGEEGKDRLKLYATVSWDEEGRAVRVGMKCGREGSLERALVCVVADMATLALEQGVGLEVVAKRFRHIAFDPAGMTGDRECPMASSILDWVGKWMQGLCASGGQALGEKGVEEGHSEC